MRSTTRAAVMAALIGGLPAATVLAQTEETSDAELPAVVVEQEKPEAPAPASKPAKKAKTAKARPKPAPAISAVAAPATATAGPSPEMAVTAQAPGPGTSGGGKAVVGQRSGSLTVPTTAEATAEIQQTPGAVEVVSDQAYKPSTPSATLKDALDYVPGVFVQTKWGEDTRLSIRGSGLSRNFHGRGIQLIMDGIVPVTTADGASDFQEIDPTAYRYIEVYKGANALRFGANALGGAINFVMPTGYDADLFGTRLDIGSFGFRKLAVSSGAVSGPVDYFITGTWQEQDGFRDHSDGESVRGAMNVGYRLSRDAETRFYLNANHVRQRIPGALTKSDALTNPKQAFVLPGEPLLPFFPESHGNDNVDRDYQRNIDSVRFANRTSVRLAPGTLVEFGGFYFDRHLDHPILFVIDNENREGGGFARIADETLIGGHRNRFVAGVSFHNGEVRARQYRNLLGQRGDLFNDVDQISRNTVLYAENSLFIRPDVALVTGAQYVYASRKVEDRFLSNGDQSGGASYDFWNPKVGILWDVTPNAQIFANISKSAEAPTFSEMAIATGSTTSLHPQEAVTFEVGTRGANDDFRWDVAVYRSLLENEFQCLSVASSGLCTQTNLDRSIHQGVELGIGATLWNGIFEAGPDADRLWLNAAYTFNDFRFDDDPVYGDNQLPGAPRHLLRAELLYKHPSGIYAGPNVEWVPEAYYVDSANTLDTEAYAIWGAKIGFDDGGPVTAYIEGRNLSDETYISSVSIASKADAASALFEPGSGRAIYAGVQVKW